MNALVTKDQAAEYLGLKTPEAAEKLLARLGVRKVDFSIIGGKGIRYRKAEIVEALAKIEVNPNPPRKVRKPKPPSTDLFDLPIKEQMALLTAGGIQQ